MQEKDYRILSINPGSTSTKFAIYLNEKRVFKDSISHDPNELAKYENTMDQLEMREKLMQESFDRAGIDLSAIDATVGRGGMLKPLKSGAYEINDIMLKRLFTCPISQHASNLGAPLAHFFAKYAKAPSFVYDSVVVDEMDEIAKVTGLPEIRRPSIVHALNCRAAAIKVAQRHGREYKDMNFVVAHLGGGTSMCALKKGKMVDILSDDEGPLAPERSGKISPLRLLKFCYAQGNTESIVFKKIRGQGGFLAHLGTTDAIEVEKRIENGDKKAEMVYNAMIYQAAKSIGELAVAIDGDVDYIILTGGLSYSKMVTNGITKKAGFIAPVEVVPGENELEALAMGVLRVLRGEEEAHQYDFDDLT